MEEAPIVGEFIALRKYWEEFKAFAVAFDPFETPTYFKYRMDRTTPLGVMGAVQAMREVVETYDLAIKSMKGSTTIPDKQKVEQFHTMLEEEFKLFEGWAWNLVGRKGFSTHWKWPLIQLYSTTKRHLAVHYNE